MIEEPAKRFLRIDGAPGGTNAVRPQGRCCLNLWEDIFHPFFDRMCCFYYIRIVNECKTLSIDHCGGYRSEALKSVSGSFHHGNEYRAHCHPYRGACPVALSASLKQDGGRWIKNCVRVSKARTYSVTGGSQCVKG